MFNLCPVVGVRDEGERGGRGQRFKSRWQRRKVPADEGEEEAVFAPDADEQIAMGR